MRGRASSVTTIALALLATAMDGIRAQPAGDPPATSAAPVSAGAMAARECLFVPGTAIPRLAIGVTRPGDPPEVRERSELEFWADTSPAAAEEPVAVRPLFVPFYVYEERPGVGTTWYRLGDAYATTGETGTRQTGPLGWVDGRRLQLLTSRYAYHFANPKRIEPGVRLYATKQAAYAALPGPRGKPAAGAADAEVIVAERFEEDAWDPLESAAIPPFVELPVAAAGSTPDRGESSPDEALTDTTPTFPQAAENRLVRVGAVGGGPVDREKLASLKKEAQARAGIEIVFVIDETLSMKPSFGEVADFIDKNLAMDGNATNVKVAVSWYSDRTEADVREPFNVGPLEVLVGPGVQPADVTNRKSLIVEAVKKHPERTPKGDTNPRELVFEGLAAAIEKAGFTPGENAMVFVIGDAADRSSPNDLATFQDRVAKAVVDKNLQLAFIQVGDPNEPDKEFLAQAEALRLKLPPDKRDSVVVQAVKNQALAMRIADIQSRMEDRRRVLLREIERIETRNRYSRPGPAMARLIEADGLSIEEFDQRSLQSFVPAYGWLYHPEQPAAEPQLRELVFMAKPEEDALMAALIDAAGGIRKAGAIDGDAAVTTLARVLAKNSGHSQVEAVLRAAWEKVPASERTVGAFLRDSLGLRVRSSVLYHRGVFKPVPATDRAADLLVEHKERLFRDRSRTPPRGGMPPPVWHDAWKVLP